MEADEEITNAEDIIDSRDINERIKWLENNQYDFQIENGLDEYPGYTEKSDEDSKWQEWDDMYGEELLNLTDLRDSYGGSEWDYGVTLIRDTYFEDYARELAQDIGAISHKEQWPLNHIDWEEASDELKVDYTDLDFDGITYWVH